MSTTQEEQNHNKPQRSCFLTESQRDGLKGEKSDNYQYHVRHILRPRIESGAIVEDLHAIREHAPDLWADIRDDLEQFGLDEASD